MICNIYILILESVKTMRWARSSLFHALKKRIEKPSEKVRNNKEMKTVHVRDESIGISLFSYLFRG